MQETSVFGGLYQWADSLHDELCALAAELNACPELGFQEYKTSQHLMRAFQSLPLEIEEFSPLPGFCATWDTGVPGPTVAILCELDALPCPEHPHADPNTGAAHCSGHHVQMAAVYGAAKALLSSGVQQALCGKIKFIAVSAVECVDLGARNELRRKGIIRLLSGKSELIAQGKLENVGAALAIHSMPSEDWRFALSTSLNGFQIKIVDVYGKAVHAAGSVHEGINALDAAQLGLNALNAWRATFQETDGIRVSPVLSVNRGAVNMVPSHVRVEMLVRGNTMQAIRSAGHKIDLAFSGSAQALGARSEIASYHGYFPFQASKELNRLAGNVAKNISGEQAPLLPHGYDSTDLGDLSLCMPVIQPYVSGCAGSLHGADFRVTDERCYTEGAKLLAGIAADLLVDSGTFIEHLERTEPPVFATKEAYLEAAEQFFDRI